MSFARLLIEKKRAPVHRMYGCTDFIKNSFAMPACTRAAQGCTSYSPKQWLRRMFINVNYTYTITHFWRYGLAPGPPRSRQERLVTMFSSILDALRQQVGSKHWQVRRIRPPPTNWWFGWPNSTIGSHSSRGRTHIWASCRQSFW